jgi:hypothetical protein
MSLTDLSLFGLRLLFSQDAGLVGVKQQWATVNRIEEGSMNRRRNSETQSGAGLAGDTHHSRVCIRKGFAGVEGQHLSSIATTALTFGKS